MFILARPMATSMDVVTVQIKWGRCKWRHRAGPRIGSGRLLRAQGMCMQHQVEVFAARDCVPTYASERLTRQRHHAGQGACASGGHGQPAGINPIRSQEFNKLGEGLEAASKVILRRAQKGSEEWITTLGKCPKRGPGHTQTHAHKQQSQKILHW